MSTSFAYSTIYLQISMTNKIEFFLSKNLSLHPLTALLGQKFSFFLFKQIFHVYFFKKIFDIAPAKLNFFLINIPILFPFLRFKDHNIFVLGVPKVRKPYFWNIFHWVYATKSWEHSRCFR